ncbi:MAG: glutamate 5-kinase [Candidatus Abyssobacteria bacterium SURF_17]|uniref:Glutamate 5-kinase n=1 Tax=Candidatus Abyssobacteria bacterium SURF_17 TaxID=2093361 RepID=A0A419EYW0_9BACT|nr:MAG: glutamate 5-kinase [Candidatus Abyssubacteria bacterium SURF_17]
MNHINVNDINIVVVKVGTTLVSSSKEFLDKEKMKPIVGDIADLVENGVKVILVSSGAIGAGMAVLGLKTRPKLLPQKQAAAAIGQSKLMHFYKDLFNEHELRVAQILLTKDDLDDRTRYLNARNTISTLLQYKNIVPIINENDTVAVNEIKFGDNDTLAAVVAAKMQADLLIILSNIDGFFDCDPRKSAVPKLIEEVTNISDDLKKMCGAPSGETSVGGMASKLEAARIATLSGIAMILANGERLHALREIFSGAGKRTYFHPRREAITGRKRWIAFGSAPHGRITIDQGAKHALIENGKSLLPSGVVAVTGKFEPGDTVSIVDEQNTEIARGLVNYSTSEVMKIRGAHTKKIAELLGYKDYDEVVHRNNLVLL